MNVRRGSNGERVLRPAGPSNAGCCLCAPLRYSDSMNDELIELDRGDAATIATLTAIADMRAELRALSDALAHPNAGFEQRLAASYTLTDLAEQCTSLRFALELSL